MAFEKSSKSQKKYNFEYVFLIENYPPQGFYLKYEKLFKYIYQ